MTKKEDCFALFPPKWGRGYEKFKKFSKNRYFFGGRYWILIKNSVK